MKTKKSKRIMKDVKTWYMRHVTYIWKYRKGITRKSKPVSAVLTVLVTVLFPMIGIMELAYALCSFIHLANTGHSTKFSKKLANHFRFETVD